METIRHELTDDFLKTRKRTLDLVKTLKTEDFLIQTAEFMSPPRWHLGHTTWLFEMILSEFIPQRKPYRDDFQYFFNSYYFRFGSRIDRARRGTRSRPTIDETLSYRAAIENQVCEFLSVSLPAELDQRRQRLIRMGLEHEQQHQELLIWDIKHLLRFIRTNVGWLPDFAAPKPCA